MSIHALTQDGFTFTTPRQERRRGTHQKARCSRRCEECTWPVWHRQAVQPRSAKSEDVRVECTLHGRKVFAAGATPLGKQRNRYLHSLRSFILSIGCLVVLRTP